MASNPQAGLASTETVFGKSADLYDNIKTAGRIESPFFSKIGSLAPLDRSNPAAGRVWSYYTNVKSGTDNAHHEGSAPASAIHFEGSTLTNHYQIFKDTTGVSGSEDATSDASGKKALARNMSMIDTKHKFDIELALLSSSAPVMRDKTSNTKGRLGGVGHYLTASTTIAHSNETLSWKFLREQLKLGFLNGVTYNCIMMNDGLKDQLDDILFSKANNLQLSANKIDNNVTTIGNTPYGGDIPIVLNAHMAQGEILMFNTDWVHAVVWRPTTIKDIPDGDDAIKKQLITELTLQIDHEYAISKSTGFKV